MNLRTITLFAVALTLYLVGSTALGLISSLLPIPIPVECILIGLFMGMFPRRTATVFYTVTCGLLIVETTVNIPNLITIMQTGMNLALAMESIHHIEPIITNSYSMALWIVVIVSSVVVLVKYRMKAVKVFFGIMLNLLLITVYALVPFVVFTFVIIRLSGASADNITDAFPILFTYIIVLWDIYLTVTGPLVTRWMFRRIGIYRRIPKIWQ